MLLLALVLVAWNEVAAGPTETSFGDIFGHTSLTSDGQRCEEFLGIPFAEKPQRFMSPQPWKTAYGAQGLVAAKYGPWCPQMNGEQASGDEDCLFLNVWRPLDTAPGTNLTVMVWIYGGSFVFGDGGDSETPNTYNGCGLAARHDVIVASMNYRLGPLGFAALAKPTGGVDANWGLQDQREALRWLQQEVASFGGHPKKVTIFGESAGAQSVWHHLASQRSAGLFRAAITESGMPSAFGGKFAVKQTLAFAGLAGCTPSGNASVRACLMQKSMKDLITTAGKLRGDPENHWGPTIDGVELTDYPDVLLQQNRTHPVPILAGINTNEGTCFVYPGYANGMNESQYLNFVKNTLTGGDRGLTGKELQKVFHKYPPASIKDFRALASELFTDQFLCRETMATGSLSTRARAFFYRFNHRPTCPQPDPGSPGAYHGLELPYVFGTPTTYDCNFTTDEKALSGRMQTMWTNFAKNLNPSITGQAFPAFDSRSQRSIVLQTPVDTSDNGYRQDFCKVWADIWKSRESDLPSLVV